MDIRRLEIFLKLLETRSFSKTATALELTQPSVSASLKSLEESLGQRLFERTPRAVKPLAAALVLAPYAESIVDTMGRAAWAVANQLANPRERLTLGASSVPAVVFAPRALAAFHRNYPNILIKMKTGQSRGVAQKVADGELDLGLVGAPPDNDELACDPLGRDRLVLMAAKKLADAVGPPPRSVDDLLNWPLIMREEGSGTRAALLAAVGASEAARGRLNVLAEVEGLEPALALVRSSFGATVGSSLITPLLNRQGLIFMPLDFLEGRSFYLIRRSSGRPSPALEALTGFLLEAADKLKEKDGDQL